MWYTKESIHVHKNASKVSLEQAPFSEEVEQDSVIHTLYSGHPLVCASGDPNRQVL